MQYMCRAEGPHCSERRFMVIEASDVKLVIMDTQLFYHGHRMKPCL
jgi:hypothetical protein